jgi:hypothetical protein
VTGALVTAARSPVPRWLPAFVLAAASLTSPAFDVDDMERFTYINNVTEPTALVWGYGYFDLLPSLATFVLAVLPLPVQVIVYRLSAFGAGLLLYYMLRRLLARWQPEALDPALAALTIMLLLHAIEPWLLANLSWINWSLFLAAVAALLARVRDPGPLPPAEAIGVTAALLTSPPGILATPLLFVDASGARRLRRDRTIIALVVIAWDALQAWFWAGEWLPQAGTVVAAVAADFAAGVWRHNMLIGASSVVVLAVTMAVAVRSRTRAAEHLMLGYLGWASLAAFALSPRAAEQGFEARYVLIPAFCAIVAIADAIGLLPPRWLRLHARAGAAAAVVLTLLTLLADRRGPIVLWWQKVQFASAAAEFRRHCGEGEAMAFEDEPATIVVLCRRRQLPPGMHPIVGARTTRGAPRHDAPLDERPAIVVPDRIF